MKHCLFILIAFLSLNSIAQNNNLVLTPAQAVCRPDMVSNSTVPLWQDGKLIHAFSTAEALPQAGQWQMNPDTTLRSSKKRPPLPSKTGANEYLGGLAGGTILAVAGAGIGLLFAPPKEEWSFFGPGEIYIGAAAGYVLGSAIGVTMVGNYNNLNGKFLYAIGGNIIGAILSGGMFYFSAGTTFENFVPFFSLLVMPPMGAIVGYNLSRQYNPNASTRLKVEFGTNNVVLKFNF